MKQWKTLTKFKIQPFDFAQGRQSKVKSDEIIKILLANRGIRTKKDIDNFFDPKIEDVTIKSADIDKKEVQKTIQRIKKAIKKKEQIIIFGDYDTDGICGTAILWETLYKDYKNVFPYIPNRKGEGYGLSEKGIRNISNLYPNCKLIITVDNGIVANKPVEFANKENIDIIITDHHQVGKKLPKAYAIVHTTKVCGAAVAWLLSQEIKSYPFDKLRAKIKNNYSDNHLELVALATVADMVPLVGLNRTILKFGLEELKKTKRIGFLELFKEAGLRKEELSVYEIGHMIAPRLNATGRVSHAMDSLRLLCTNDLNKAKEFADLLGNTNRERQQMTIETTDHAKSIFIEENNVSKIILIANQEYDQGVIGLVASRLVEEYYRPSLVISIGEKYSKGSARSVKGFNIIEFLRTFSDYLLDVGGHPMAAGFTIETAKIEEFKRVLERKANETISEELLKRTVIIDVQIGFENINHELYCQLQKFSPFGVGNPEPTFMTKNVIILDLKTVGMGGKHLKLILQESVAKEKPLMKFDAIGFGLGERAKEIKIGDEIKIVYTIEEDSWLGNKKLQLKIKDVKLSNF